MSVLLISLVLGCLIGGSVFQLYARLKKSRSLKKVSKRAQLGESEAVALLQSKGYRIVDEQVRMPVRMLINDEIYESFVKADLIVEKHNKRYVVEVKTGKQANIHLPNVRRQLYEYQNIFQPDGILFVDMNNYDIMNVIFKMPGTKFPQLGSFFLGVVSGVCLILIILSYF